MRISSFPILTAIMLFFAALLLVLGSSYFCYQFMADHIVQDQIFFLSLAKESVYDSPHYYQTSAVLPDSKYATFEKISKNPGVVFLRVVNPITGDILWTSLSDEKIGQKIVGFPSFSDQTETKNGNWQGTPVEEIFVSGDASEGIWLALSLAPVKREFFSIAAKQGIVALIVLFLVHLILYYALRRNILNPLRQIYSSITQIRSGKLDIKINLKQKNEIGELAGALNEMIDDLKESQEALTEAKDVLEVRVRARTRELKELVENLDEEVKKKTKEVQEKMTEMERFNKIAVGRELRMIELKEEIKKLKKEKKKKS